MGIRATCWILGGGSDGGDIRDSGSVRWVHDMVRKESFFPRRPVKEKVLGNPQCGFSHRSREEAGGSRETRFLSHVQVVWHRWGLGVEGSRCHRQIELRDLE